MVGFPLAAGFTGLSVVGAGIIGVAILTIPVRARYGDVVDLKFLEKVDKDCGGLYKDNMTDEEFQTYQESHDKCESKHYIS